MLTKFLGKSENLSLPMILELKAVVRRITEKIRSQADYHRTVK